MGYRMIYFVVTLSFIALFPSRFASQDTRDTNWTRMIVSQKAKGPSRQDAWLAVKRCYHAPLENPRTAKSNETETTVSEARAAEQFMQLKAQLNADLIRAEEMRNAEPIQNIVRASKADLHIGGYLTGSSDNLIEESRAQIMGDSPSVPSDACGELKH